MHPTDPVNLLTTCKYERVTTTVGIIQICIAEVRVRITIHWPTSPADIFMAFRSPNLMLNYKRYLPYPLHRIARDDPDIPDFTHLTQHRKQIRNECAIVAT